MKTCSPAIAIINALSATLKLNIRLSVLFTVLIFRFSRVRKYFWFRLIVDKSRDTLRIDSSSADVCSGELPCLLGSRASRDSFSTWRINLDVRHVPLTPRRTGMDIQAVDAPGEVASQG